MPDKATIYCSTCGRPLGEDGVEVKRRTQDWQGVKLQLTEKYFLALVVAGANGIAAAITVLTR